MQINPSISVKQILRAGWGAYKLKHQVRDVEQKEVGKALNCYGCHNGSFVYSCKKCGAWIFQSRGCNSRICSNCGKNVSIVDAQLIETVSDFTMANGKEIAEAHWHKYRCPYCNFQQSIYIGNVDELSVQKEAEKERMDLELMKAA